MSSILFVLFLFWAAVTYAVTMHTSDLQKAGVEGQFDLARATAVQGALVMQKCITQTTAGVYTAANLMGTEFPSATPAGSSFICVVRSGGTLPTGMGVVLLFDSAPQRIDGLLPSDPLRSILAQNIAGYWRQQAAAKGSLASSAQPLYRDSFIGVVYKGDATPLARSDSDGYRTLSLAGIIASPASYTSPVWAAGFLASTY